jgi:Flp pilus assembly CpaE family ATPase
VPRPAIVIALPAAEAGPVSTELREAGFDPITVSRPDQLEAILAERSDVAVAILDGETDFDVSLEYYSVLHDEERAIASLMVVSQRALERLAGNPEGSADDEYLTRPYSAESMRWRIEAMCIRSHTVDDGSGPVLGADALDPDLWGHRATVIAIFNPKGGVGKTTIATNLAATLQLRKGKQVLLVDADTVTGHVTTSLGIDQVQTVVDSWNDAEAGEDLMTFADLASQHTSGMRIVALTASPLHLEALEPERVADSIAATRRGYDFVIVDLHPSYSALNRAIFDRSDKILVPVTPDVPALRAAVQLRDVASELRIRDRLAMIVNRANSGVSVVDMERTVGMPAMAQIRSGGLLFVHAANEGRTVIEMYPRDKITEDFDALADRVLGVPLTAPALKSGGFRLFSRSKAPARV